MIPKDLSHYSVKGLFYLIVETEIFLNSSIFIFYIIYLTQFPHSTYNFRLFYLFNYRFDTYYEINHTIRSIGI